MHRHRPFPLGHPTARLPALPTTTLLIDERALTPQERRRLLDAADLLPVVGGRSQDRHRHRGAAAKPVRKTYRPWRDRAIVYLLTPGWGGTGGSARITSTRCGPRGR